MKKAILPLILLFLFSLGFSDAISDFVTRNLNFVVSAFVFLLVFGISIGTAGMWVDDKAQLVIISLGISALISVLVLLNPNLSDLVYSVISYSPIFLIAFILVALVLIIFIAKKPWQKGLAAAILIAAIAGLIIMAGGINGIIAPGSGTDSQANSTTPLLFLSLIGLIGLVIGIGILTKKLKTGSVFGGGISLGSTSPTAPVKNILDATVRKIKVIIVEDNPASPGNFMAVNNDPNVIINGSPYALTSGNAPEFTLLPADVMLRITFNNPATYSSFFIKKSRFENNCKVKKAKYNDLSDSSITPSNLKGSDVKPVNSITSSPLEIQKANLDKYNFIIIIKKLSAFTARDVTIRGEFLDSSGSLIKDAEEIKLEYQIGGVNNNITLNRGINPSNNFERTVAGTRVAFFKNGNFIFVITGAKGNITNCVVSITDSSGTYSHIGTGIPASLFSIIDPASTHIGIEVKKMIAAPGTGNLVVNVVGINKNVDVTVKTATGDITLNTGTTGQAIFSIPTPATGIAISSITAKSAVNIGLKEILNIIPSFVLMPLATEIRSINLGARLVIQTFNNSIPTSASITPQIAPIPNTFVLYDNTGTPINTPYTTPASGKLECYVKTSPGIRRIKGIITMPTGDITAYSPEFELNAGGVKVYDYTATINFLPAPPNDCNLEITVFDAENVADKDAKVSFTHNGATYSGNTDSSGIVKFKILNAASQPKITISVKKGERKTELKDFSVAIGDLSTTIKLGAILNFISKDGTAPKPNEIISVSSAAYPLCNKDGSLIVVTPLQTNASGKLKAYVYETGTTKVKFTCMGIEKDVTVMDGQILDIIFDQSASKTITNLDITVNGPLGPEEKVIIELKNETGTNIIKNSAGLEIKDLTNNKGGLQLTIDNIPATGSKDFKLFLKKGERQLKYTIPMLKRGIDQIITINFSSLVQVTAKQLSNYKAANLTLPTNTFMDNDGKYIASVITNASATPLDLYFNVPIDKKITAELDGITIDNTVKENDNGKKSEINFDFPNHLKVVVVEKNASGNYDVVSQDDEVIYGKNCMDVANEIPSGNKYKVNAIPHHNYFRLTSSSNFNISLNSAKYAYTNHTIIKNDDSALCKLGTGGSSFNNFTGTETNINILNLNVPIMGGVLGVKQAIFNLKYNYLVILRELKDKYATLSINIIDALGNPMTGATITSIQSSITSPFNAFNPITIFDNSLNPITLPHTISSSHFDCKILADGKTDTALKIEVTKGGFKKTINIPHKIIKPGDNITI